MINKNIFGLLFDGTPVNRYIITNNYAEYVELLDFGASIHSINVKDKQGRLGDVVLGVCSAQELETLNCEGSVMGRVGNRIAFGKCTIEGRELQLDINSKGHYLHGGNAGYAMRKFDASISPNGKTVIMRLVDEDGGGFHTKVNVEIRYTWDDTSTLTIEYMFMPEETTVISPTNHAYFNLGGYSDIRDHYLYINAEYYAVKNRETNVPEGRISHLKGTPLDFSTTRKIGEAMEFGDDVKWFEGKAAFDDCFLIENSEAPCAILTCRETGRRMTVHTDMQGLILFTPNRASRWTDKHGKLLPDYGAVCLETQFVPNAVNCKEFKSPIFQGGCPFISKTSYKFETE